MTMKIAAIVTAFASLWLAPVAAKTVFDVASASADHTAYVYAAEKTGLASILKGTGPLTVFAPNNAAFFALGATGEKLLLNDEWVLHLRDIMLHHTVPRQFTILNLVPGFTDTALSGETLTVTSVSPPSVNGAQIVGYDLGSSNGIYLALNAVILPSSATKDIVDIAASTENLEAFASTLSPTGVDSTLRSDGPYTVFAPTNAAFSAFSDLSTYDAVSFADVLKYHVVPGIIADAELTEGATFTTEHGATLTVSSLGTVVKPNILAKNGIIHAIDTVLTPPADSLVESPIMSNSTNTTIPSNSTRKLRRRMV